jgi:hypothetical protein
MAYIWDGVGSEHLVSLTGAVFSKGRE